MKKMLFTILVATLSLSTQVGSAKEIERAEPMSWWIGMNQPLQIMFYGDAIGQMDQVKCLEAGVWVKEIHYADSPNYLFVDVEIDADAKPGLYTFEFTAKSGKKIDFKYRIDARREKSAERASFASSDMVYLIMPDRFSNGDQKNDNTENTTEKVDITNPHGRHGGDIQGIINNLDYIADLGVTTLWSTPMLLDNEPTYSYHGYATADYYKIDPRFGDNELYRTFVAEAHKRNIKVIMDMVPNHCGASHPWVADLPFKDWINYPDNISKDNSSGNEVKLIQTNNIFTSASDPHGAQADIKECVEGWFDRPMPDMNLRNKFVLNYFTQWATWWIEWAGLDGLRVDTFPYSDKFHIAQWVHSIRDEYPNLNIVGEVWVNSPSQLAYWDGASNNRDGYNSNLKSIMDFPLQQAIIEALGDQTAGWGEGLTKVYNVLAHDFVHNDPRSLMIFSGNHDTDRLAYHLKGDMAKAKLVMTMLATLRGVPQLYYGDELLLLGNQKEGHGGQRIDFPGGWKDDKIDLFDKSYRTEAQQELHAHTKKLFNWRKEASVIHNGKTLHFIPKNNLYIYFRYTDSQSVMTIINGSNTEQNIDWERLHEATKEYNSGIDIVNNTSIEINKPLTIASLTSMVVVLKKQPAIN